MKNTIKSILLPLVYSFSTMVVSIFISMIYVHINTYYYGYRTTEQIQNYFDSDLYKIGINHFLMDNYIYIGLIVFLLFIPYLLKKYYTENKKINKLKCDNTILIVILGIIFSGLVNIVFYELNTIHYFTNMFKLPELSLFSLLIVSGLLLPILEEYLLRGVIYKNLQKENTKMTSIIIVSILTSIISSSIPGMFYSFALSFLLIYVYEKYQTIKAPIILHITASIVQLLFIYVLGISNILNIILLVLFTFLLVLYYILIIKKDKELLKG